MFLLLALALSAADPAVFLPSEVKVGQKAYGLTVFQGDKVEKFDLVLLGVLKNYLGPQKDLVIAKLADPKLELAGVVAGMSGSPIYVEGRLLGALGYAMGAFMKEGICGITPIGMMREVRDLPTIDPFNPVTTGGAAATWGEIHPIAAPLSISGVDPSVMNHFAPTFEKMGFMLGAGGMAVSGASVAGKTKLEAGSAVAAQLVRGDLSIAATGTVTSVDGKKVLAFGHPFLGIGSASMPMASARIITIIASLNRSFKMGEVMDDVGAFTQDRLTAIAGEVGTAASTIPVTVEINTEPEGVASKFKFEIARDPRLTPDLVNMVLANSFTRRTDAGTVGTVEVEGTLTLDNNKQLKLGALLSSERDPLLPVFAAMSVSRPFEVLWKNEFGPPMVKGLDVKARVSYDVKRMSIAYASIHQGAYRSGETVRIEVGLKPDDKPVQTHTFELPLPPSFEAGEYDVVVSGAGEMNAIESRVLGQMRPLSREGLLDALNQIRRDGPLYVAVIGKGTSLRVGEALLNDVPLSWATQIAARQTDSRVSKSAQSLLIEMQKPMGAFVAGETHLTLRVRPSR